MDRRRIRLLGEIQTPFPSLFELGTEALVLGPVDVELQPVDEPPGERKPFSRYARHRPAVSVGATGVALHRYVAAARERAGLSLREAEMLTRRMADACGPAYAMARTTLEHYETSDRVPRHLAKLVALASVYALDPWHYLALAGMVMPLGTRTFDALEANSGWARPSSSVHVDAKLRHVLSIVLGRSRLAVDDLYTFGKTDHSSHPLIEPGAILVLERRRRGLRHSSGASPVRNGRILLLVQTPNGRHFAGYCSVQGPDLTIEPPPLVPGPVHRMDVTDALVVGRIVAVLRTQPH